MPGKRGQGSAAELDSNVGRIGAQATGRGARGSGHRARGTVKGLASRAGHASLASLLR